MGHVCRASLPALVLLGLLGGCGTKPPPPDAEQIVGEWVIMDFHSPAGTEDRGQRRKKAVVTEGTWSQQFQGDRFEDFEYTLDPAKTPKEIDLTYTAPDGRRLTSRGIYELAGDRLRVCLGSALAVQKDGKTDWADGVRPGAFAATHGVLISFRRATR